MLYRDVTEGFLERARTGRVSLGVHTSSMSPQLIELYGFSGLDFVILSTEVEPLDSGRMDDLLRAANAARTLPIVKIRRPDPDLVADWLTFGAPMVMVPHITSGPQLEQMIAASKFAPLGTRGQCPAARYTGYSTIDLDASRDMANRTSSVIPIIEDREALSRLDEIAAVPGYDILEIGPFDLGLSLGQPGVGYHSPVVLDAIEEIAAAARRHGKAVAAPLWVTGDTDSASKIIAWQMEQLISRGVTILYSIEVVQLSSYFRTLMPLRGVRLRTDAEAAALEAAEEPTTPPAARTSAKAARTVAKAARTPAKAARTPAKAARTPAKAARTPAKAARTPAKTISKARAPVAPARRRSPR